MNRENFLEEIRNSKGFPKIPEHASRLFAILRHPEELDLDTLIKEVSRIQGLEEAALALVNSPDLARPHGSRSLREAVLFLGTRPLRNLLIALITRSLFPSEAGRLRKFDRAKYWRHCLGTSIACEGLSRKIGWADRYGLFPYGLLHDIGIALVDLCLPEILDEIYDLIEQQQCSIVQAERMVMPLSHDELGAWLSHTWGLPEDISHVIQYHHSPQKATTFVAEVNLVYLGDRISTEYYEKLLGHSSSLQFQESVANQMGLSANDMQEIRRDLSVMVEENLRLLGLNILIPA